MQQDNSQGEVKAVILLQISEVVMHRFVKNEKTMFTSGTCKIAKLENNKNNPVYFINLNSFYYGIHKDIFFVKMIYDDTVSYLFPHFENGLSSITLLTTSPHIHSLDSILSNAATLFDYFHANDNPEIRNKILEHCPQISKEPIYYTDNVKKAISASGKVLNSAFTMIGGLFKTGVTKVGNYLNEKIEPTEPTHLKPQTKQKWQKLKSGTNTFFKVSSEYANILLTPVIQKTKQYTKDLKQKIEKSQNQKVKYAKELAKVSGKAIEEAFDGFVKGGSELASQLSQQSKKIITKKYGEEVLNTITGKKEEVTHQKENIDINYGQKTEDKYSPVENESSRSLLSNGNTQQNLYPSINENKK